MGGPRRWRPLKKPFPDGFMFGEIRQRGKYCIYAFFDRQTGNPLYVGQSINVFRRILEHWHCGSRVPLRAIHASGKQCVIGILAAVDTEQQADIWESVIICAIKPSRNIKRDITGRSTPTPFSGKRAIRRAIARIAMHPRCKKPLKAILAMTEKAK